MFEVEGNIGFCGLKAGGVRGGDGSSSSLELEEEEDDDEDSEDEDDDEEDEDEDGLSVGLCISGSFCVLGEDTSPVGVVALPVPLLSP